MSDTVLATDAAVHHAHQAYLDAINTNDVGRLLATVTDDIVFLPPNSEPIAGKEAVGAWVAGYFEAIQTVWTKTTVELVVGGDLAYEWYRYHVVDTPRDGGEATTDTGNGVNIYRLDADRTWHVWRDIWATAS
ncbi:MAG: nuclear transport factor 2 family protein [Actinomycetota bacterium]|nr:nuclear transport factor 2 family protein [Actinomycetota bacterium]